MKREYATKVNYSPKNHGLIPHDRRGCNCYSTISVIFNEDPQQVWRCSSCGAASLHPFPGIVTPFQLDFIVLVGKLENGERIWKAFPTKSE